MPVFFPLLLSPPPPSPPSPLHSLTVMSAPSAELTFTPGVEEHEDVLAAVVSCCRRRLGLGGAARRRQPVLAAHGAGWRVDGQLHLVAALLHNLGLPAFTLQRIHERNGGMGAFGDHGQGT